MEIFDAIYGAKPWLLALALPPTPLLLVAAIGGWLAWHRRPTGVLLLATGLVLAWFSCTERAGEFLMTHLVNAPAPLAKADIERLARDREAGRRTAVLVLGGGLVRHLADYGKSQDPNQLSMERLRYGIWLARQIGAPLGISGGVARGGDPAAPAEAVTESEVARTEFGLSPHWVETLSRDTRENARFSVAMLRRDGIQRIVVVTHQMHIPRALRAFEVALESEPGAAIDIVAAGVDARRRDLAFGWRGWTTSVHGFRETRYAVHEWLAWVAGH